MLIGTVADFCPLPFLFQRGMVEASSGRLVLFFVEQGHICYRVKQPAEESWSEPVAVAEGSRDFSVCIDGEDNICLAYIRGNGLYFRKLSPWMRKWKMAGKEVEVTLGADGCSYASIALQGGALWAAACACKQIPTEIIDGTYMIQDQATPEKYEYTVTIKRSTDGGRTWNPSHSLVSGACSVPVLVTLGGRLACVYSQGLSLRWLSRGDAASPELWEERGEIVNDMTAIDLFTCCAASDGLHILFKKSGIGHVFFDGATWKGDPVPFSKEAMDSDAVMSSSGRGLWAFWSRSCGPGRSALCARPWEGQNWGKTVNLSPPFDTCLAFDGSVYRDITGTVTRDGSPLVPFEGDAGSALYFGSGLPFTGLAMDLSGGEGGSYSFEFWNGEEWEEVIGLEDGTGGLTAPGVVGFGTLMNPGKVEVDGLERFWLRIRRTSAATKDPAIGRAFPLGPLGSLATADTVHGFVTVAWVDATSRSSRNLLCGGIAADHTSIV